MINNPTNIMGIDLPENWSELRFNKICEFDKKTVDPLKNPDQMFNYITISDIQDYRINSYQKVIGKEAPSRARKKVVEGDIIVSTVRPYLRAFAKIDRRYNNYVYSTGFSVITPKEKVLPDYIYYLIQTDQFANELMRRMVGATYPAVTSSDIKHLRVPVPPLVEQRGVVEVLGTVDECIRLTDSVIERAEELKRGLMQQLLTRGIGHTEYKETKLGEIPKLWNIKKIKKACEKPQYGYTASANEKPIGPKFLRITDIKDGLVNWAEVPFCECNTNDYNKYKIKKGDIVFARTGATTGKSYLIKHDVDAIFASYLIRLIAKDDVDPRFLYIFFNSELYWKQIRQRMVGSAQGGVNAAVLSNLDLPFPDKKEQSKIADIIFEVESNISHEKKKKELFINLKRGLMQQLLSGKIRVELKGDGLHRIGDSREANN